MATKTPSPDVEAETSDVDATAATELAAPPQADPSILAEIAGQAEQLAAARAGTEPEDDVLVNLDEGDGDRPTVLFEGKIYEIAVMDDFSLRDQKRLGKKGRDFFALHSSEDDLTDEQDEEMEALLDWMFEKIFRASAAVKKRVSPFKRSQVVLGFTLAPLVEKAKKEARRQAALEQEQAQTE